MIPWKIYSIECIISGQNTAGYVLCKNMSCEEKELREKKECLTEEAKGKKNLILTPGTFQGLKGSWDIRICIQKKF